MNNNQAVTNQERQPYKIEVDPIKFDGLLKSKLISTNKIGNLIGGLFKPVFSDYEGCIIYPDMNGQLQVTLYFKDKGKMSDANSLKAIKPVGQQTPSSSAFDRISTINQRLASKKYELTTEAKEIFSDFIYVQGNQKPNWNNFITEVASQDYYGHSIYVKVSGLSLIKLIRKIYGGKAEGSRVDYAISILKPIGMDVTGVLQNFLVSIQQLDTKEVESLAQEIGVIPVQGNIPMIR